MLNLGIIGVGNFGEKHLRTALANPRVKVVMLSGTTQLYEGVQLGSVTDVLEHDVINAVIIASPTKTHSDLTFRALSAGKHVLVEKPASLSVEALLRIQGLRKHVGRVFLEGHQYRFHRGVQAFKDVLKKYPGTELSLEGEYVHSVGREVPGPYIWEIGTHFISILEYLGAFEGAGQVRCISRVSSISGMFTQLSLSNDYYQCVTLNLTTQPDLEKYRFLHLQTQRGLHSLHMLGDQAAVVDVPTNPLTIIPAAQDSLSKQLEYFIDLCELSPFDDCEIEQEMTRSITIAKILEKIE